MKKTAVLETMCTKIVFGIAAAMFFALTFWAVKYSHRYNLDYTSEKVWGNFDSMPGNMIMFLVIFVIFYILQLIILRGTEEQKHKRVKIFLIIDMIVVGIMATVWVTGCHIKPSDDQLQVYLTSVEFSQGIYRDMEAYFYMYTQQYGLAFLYECVLWIWESYHLIQYINIAFLIATIYFGYKISDVLFNNPRINFYTILVMNLFFPLFIYINFVYGESGIVAMCLCSIWSVLKWTKTGKNRFAVLAIIAMTLAMLARLNMVIIAIALVIMLLMFSLRNKNWKALVVAGLLFVIPFVTIEAVKFSYEVRSGLEVSKGSPAVLHIAMGMQDSWQGAGAYNAYNNSTFWGAAGGDSELASQIGWDYIRGRLQEFKADLGTARYFYQNKIWQQWNEGSYGSIIMTNKFDAAPFRPAQELYGGRLREASQNYMERYLFVIYLMAFVYSMYGFLFEKELKKTILPMIVIGGMIFSLLWEAKARYVFPYVAVLLPAVAAGLHFCQFFIENGVNWIKDKMKQGGNNG